MYWTEKEALELIENVKRGKGGRETAQMIPAPVALEIRPKMNGTETRYANLLELRKRVGQIKDYRFEGITLLLTPSKPGMKAMRYTPDFEVIRMDDRIELHETKGNYTWEDSWLKFKTAVDKFPEFKFTFARWVKGEWMFPWKDEWK
jgi:hypothetical protein